MNERNVSTTDPASGWQEYQLDVLSGAPNGETSGLVDRTRDGCTLSAGVFRAQPGSYQVVSDTDEVIVVLAGRTRIEFDDGQVFNLKAGDTATIPCGSTSTRHILEDYREFYVVTGPVPA